MTQTAEELRREATAICKRQPGYGTPQYRGDPYDAVALQQEAERLERDDKRTTIELLRKWINQRPGLEPQMYDNRSGYQSESRRVQQQRRDALTLLRAVEWRDGITAEMLRERSQHAFAGRLELKPNSIDYCTGQYWPTEFRAAACAVLASALRYYWREDVPENIENKSAYLSAKGRREFGRGIGSRWFHT